MEREDHRIEDRWQTLRDSRTDSSLPLFPCLWGWIVVLNSSTVAPKLGLSITLECWEI